MVTAAPGGRYLPEIRIADTACELDLTGICDIAVVEMPWPIDAAERCTLPMVGAHVHRARHLLCKSKAARAYITLYVMTSSLFVLSIGRICLRDGPEFWWPSRWHPILMSPNGERQTSRSLLRHTIMRAWGHGSFLYAISSPMATPALAGQPLVRSSHNEEFSTSDETITGSSEADSEVVPGAHDLLTYRGDHSGRGANRLR